MLATPWWMVLLACAGTPSDRDDTDVARVVGWVAACGVLLWVVVLAFGVGDASRDGGSPRARSVCRRCS